MRPSMTSEQLLTRRRASPGPRRGWPRHRSCRSRRGREIIIKYSVLSVALPRKIYLRLTRNLLYSGIQINFKTKKKRKQQRKSLWILLQQKRFLQTLTCVQSMTQEKIPLTQKVVVEVITPSDMEVNSSTSQEGIHLGEDLSSLNSISTDLTAFTQSLSHSLLLNLLCYGILMFYKPEY